MSVGMHVRVLCLLIASSTSGAAALHPFSVQDLLKTEKVAGVALAPDRIAAAVVIIRPAQPGEHFERYFLRGHDRADIWLVTARASRNLTNGADDASGWWAPAWSPSGRYLAMLSTRGQDDLHLYVLDTASGEFRRATSGIDLDLNLGGRRDRLLGPPYEWCDDETLLVSLRGPEEPDRRFASGLSVIRLQESRWSAMKAGAASSSALVSTSRPAPMVDRHARTLVTLNVRTAAQKILARGIFHAAAVSQNRQKIAVAVAIDATPPRDRLQFPTGHGGYALDALTARHRVAIIDVDSARREWLPDSIDPVIFPSAERQMQWSPDGHYLALIHKIQPGDAATGRLALFTALGAAAPAFAMDATVDRFAWNGRNLLVHWASGQKGAASAWQLIGAGTQATSGLAHLPADVIDVVSRTAGHILLRPNGADHLDPATGSLVSLFASPRSVLTRVPIMESAGEVALTSGSERDRRLHVLTEHQKNNDRPAFESVSLPCTGYDILAVAEKFGAALVKCDDRTGTSLRWTGRATDAVAMSFNRHLAEIDATQSLFINYEAEDGSDQHALLLLPHGNRQGKPYPTIVDIYPDTAIRPDGRVGLTNPTDTSWLNRLQYASAGYAVLVPSVPWPKRGSEPVNVIDIVGNGVLPAIDRAIALGIVDGARLGLRGHSYGGYAAFALLTRTTRFKAAVVSAGYSDLVSYYLQSNIVSRLQGNADDAKFPGFAETEVEAPYGKLRMGGLLWPHFETYVYNSPIRHLESVTTPTLILHGEFDGVPLAQGEEFFLGLKRLGKPAQLVTYWGESHNLASPGNIADSWERVKGWFDRYLLDREGSPAPRHDP